LPSGPGRLKKATNRTDNTAPDPVGTALSSTRGGCLSRRAATLKPRTASVLPSTAIGDGSWIPRAICGTQQTRPMDIREDKRPGVFEPSAAIKLRLRVSVRSSGTRRPGGD